MGNSSFSPGNNRRSPQRHEWEDLSYISGPLAISPSFFHHLGSLGSCLRPPRARRRAVSSAIPICECTQPHRSHPCRRDMDLTATASPDSATSNAFSNAEPLGLWGLGTAFGGRGLCARAMAWWSMESGLSGQISSECFVPQGRISAKYQTLFCPSRLA